MDNPLILRASYEGVPFPVREAKTTTSHDGTGHKAYRVPGADWEPTGLNPDEGSLVIPAVTGVEGMDWPAGWVRLVNAVKAAPIGRLVHPTRGELRVFVHRLEESAEAETRNGVLGTLQWSQHNPNAQTVPAGSDAAGSAPSATAQAEKADAALAALGKSSTLATDVDAKLALLSSTAVVSAASVTSAFETLRASVDAYRADPLVQAASGYAAMVELTALLRVLEKARAAYLPRIDDSGFYTVRVPMTLLDVAVAVYGDATLASRLVRANTLTNPNDLRPGTVLRVPPIEAA